MVKHKIPFQQSLSFGKQESGKEAAPPEANRKQPATGKGRKTATAARKLVWQSVKTKCVLYAQMIRLDKPIGWLLLLWPTLWALWLANEGIPSLHLLVVFVMGVFLTRSAGAVVNDLVDRDFDSFVERTKNRPIATGKVSVTEACGVIAALTFCAFLLVLTTNRLTVQLSIFAVCITLLYPFMKRHTYLPQVFLGFAFSWGIPMAFAASTNAVPAGAWLIFAANMLWVLIYDTIYAMVDREDDLRIGLKSTAILLDDADRLIIGIIQVMFIAALYSVGRQAGLDTAYYVALVFAGALLGYQQYLIYDRTPANCFKAFFNNNWVGLIIFSGIALSL